STSSVNIPSTTIPSHITPPPPPTLRTPVARRPSIRIICSICHEELLRNHVMEHYVEYHNDDCPYCSEVFQSHADLNDHINTCSRRPDPALYRRP
ncbi:hypothetical protein H4R33_007126, partial [Dimargaris cristalligena]